MSECVDKSLTGIRENAEQCAKFYSRDEWEEIDAKLTAKATHSDEAELEHVVVGDTWLHLCARQVSPRSGLAVVENGCDLLRRNSEGKVAIEIWAESYAALVRRFDAADAAADLPERWASPDRRRESTEFVRRLYSKVAERLQRTIDEADQIKSDLWLMRLSDTKPTQRQSHVLAQDAAVREVQRMALEAALAVPPDG